MVRIIAILLFCWGLIISCGNKRTNIAQTTLLEGNEFYVLDFEKALTNNTIDTISLNDISTDISFLHLDNKVPLGMQNLLVADIKSGYVVSSGVANQATPIMLFDRNGKFEKNLVRLGRGPGEIPNYLNWNVNVNLKRLTVDGAYLVSYSFAEKRSSALMLPYYMSDVMLLNDGNYLGGGNVFGNADGNAPYLSFFNDRGEIIEELRGRNNYVNVPEGQGVWPLESRGLYQSGTGDALFRDMFNDTIFRVRGVGDVMPYMCIYRGKLSPKKEDSFDTEKKLNQVFIRNIMESDRYIVTMYAYNNTMHSAIWDKATCEMIVNLHNKPGANIFARGLMRYHTPAQETITVNILSLTDDKIYCVLWPKDAMKFMPDVSEDDNPIILIAKLK